jgi:hypothetical protein
MDVRIEKKRNSRSLQSLSTKIIQFATLVGGIGRKRDKLMI